MPVGCTTLGCNRLPAVLVLLATWLMAPWAHAQATRIVSINQCADELLLNIVPPDTLKSVTHFVKDERVSWDALKATDVPGNSGRAEEVLSFAPDLVFAGTFSARSTVSLLRNLGVQVVELAHPESIADVLSLIRQVGEVSGYREEARALIARMQLPESERQGRVRAAVYQPNGFTTGRQSLVDDVLAAAGVRNTAADRGLASYARYPMEALLLDKPDLLILDPQVDAGPSLAHELLEHPALERMFTTTTTVTIPPQAWACGTHHVFSAIKLIRAAADRIESGHG